MMILWLRHLLDRLHPFAQAANALRAPVTLGIRLFLADAFFKAGMTKLADWDVTLALFANEYQAPLLPSSIAALLATSGEVLLPMLLTLGLAARLAATGLFVLNMLTVVSYPGMPEAAQAFHLYWSMLLAVLIAYGAGGWSVDRLLVSRLRQ